MSNPSVNRWGLNTFWYTFWATDNRYSSNLNQDKIFTQLISIYLFYGINLRLNIFSNRYWLYNQHYPLTLISYYRPVTRIGRQFGELIRYSLRQEADCVFPMKLWILKYNNWVIINQYWFHPLKRGSVNFRKKSLTSTDVVTLTPRSSRSAVRKLKTLLTFSFFRLITSSPYYVF